MSAVSGVGYTVLKPWTRLEVLEGKVDELKKDVDAKVDGLKKDVNEGFAQLRNQMQQDRQDTSQQMQQDRAQALQMFLAATERNQNCGKS